MRSLALKLSHQRYSRICEKLAVAVETEGFSSWLERIRVLLNARSISLFRSASCRLLRSGVSAGADYPKQDRLLTAPFKRGGGDSCPTTRPKWMDHRSPGPARWGDLRRSCAAQGNFQNRREVQAATVALQMAVGWILYRDQRLTAARLEHVLERSSELLH